MRRVSEQEVRNKLAKLTVPMELHAEVFKYLREQGFLDDARFAKTYAGSKLRLKKWGKMKIVQGLKIKGIKELHISNALKALDGLFQCDILSRATGTYFGYVKRLG